LPLVAGDSSLLRLLILAEVGAKGVRAMVMVWWCSRGWWGAAYNFWVELPAKWRKHLTAEGNSVPSAKARYCKAAEAQS